MYGYSKSMNAEKLTFLHKSYVSAVTLNVFLMALQARPRKVLFNGEASSAKAQKLAHLRVA